MRTWIFLYLYIRCIYAEYEFFNETKTWEDSKIYCQKTNGKLAYFYTVSVVPDDWHTLDYWVGGILHDQGFNWIAQNNQETVIPLEPLIHYRGCYRPLMILGGHRMTTLSAEKCYEMCNWTGAVGLKSVYCLCEDNLRNITLTTDVRCDVSCSGNSAEMCGGAKGVSMYNLNEKAVFWGPNQPSAYGDCVYIQKTPNDKKILWYTASCYMTMRYICYFENHEACGVRKSCIRTSVKPDTWHGSIKGCHLLNGTTAIFDVTMIYNNEDTDRLLPGEYWIGLKRWQRWEWLNGLPISESLFHLRNTLDANHKCAVLSHDGGSFGIASSLCSDKKPFICQYDHQRDEERTTIGFLKSNRMDNKETPYVNEAVLIKDEKNVSSSNDKVKERENGDEYKNTLYKSIMYLAIGVASGMGLVFAISVIVYVGKRCKSRETEFKTVRYPTVIGNPILRYASDAPSNHASSEPEVLYEIPCDAQESPFRATQRILQQNYAISRDGFPTNSWRRKKAEQRNRQPEIRNINPYNERSYGDTSFIIHNVRAQCHPNSSSQGQPIDITYTGSLDTRLRKPPPPRNGDVRLSETYSLPDQGRKLSEPILHVDTSDLYACVEKAMQDAEEDYYDNKEPTIRVTLC